jgi:hypothetical protein
VVKDVSFRSGVSRFFYNKFSIHIFVKEATVLFYFMYFKVS